MKKRLLSLLTLLSLLLFATTAGLWVRSYWRTDFFGRYPYFPDRRQYRQDMIQSRNGRLWVQFLLFSNASDEILQQMHARPNAVSAEWRRYPGAAFDPQEAGRWTSVRLFVLTYRGTPLKGFIVGIPYWLPAVLTLLLPAKAATAMAFGRRRARRVSLGRCPDCGYDLRVTPGKCPECGKGFGAGAV